jgi:hypothetical protein
MPWGKNMATRVGKKHFSGHRNLTEGQCRGPEKSLAQLLDELAVDVQELQARIPEGFGFAEWYVNKTGAPTVKGSVVECGVPHEDAVQLSHADSKITLGVLLDDGVQDGAPCRVVVSGRVHVLLKNGVSTLPGYCMFVNDVVGRADASVEPPVISVPEVCKLLGTALETVAGGIDKLCLMHLK